MSDQEINDAYTNLKARAPQDPENIHREDVYAFLQALGQFGRCLAQAGMYAKLECEAEQFSASLQQQRETDQIESHSELIRGDFFGPDQEIHATLLTPILERWETGDWSVAKCRTHGRLTTEHPLGYDVLHLASFTRDAEQRGRHLLEELTDCLQVHPFLFELALKAADDFHWAVKRQIEGDGGREPTVATSFANPRDGEASTNSAISDESAGEKWDYHRAEEDPPATWYVSEPLRGTLDELSMAFSTRSGPDARRVRRAATNKRVWVRRLPGHEWEMFFRNEKDYKVAASRLEEQRSDTLHESETGESTCGAFSSQLTDAEPDGTKEDLFVERWLEIALGIDENDGIWLFTPPPAEGARVFLTKAKKLKLGGKRRWPKVLGVFATSKDGKTALNKDLMYALRIVKTGCVSSESAAFDDGLINQKDPAPRRLQCTMADLRRIFRRLVPGPEEPQIFECNGDHHRSPFVVRYIFPDEEKHTHFGTKKQ